MFTLSVLRVAVFVYFCSFIIFFGGETYLRKVADPHSPNSSVLYSDPFVLVCEFKCWKTTNNTLIKHVSHTRTHAAASSASFKLHKLLANMLHTPGKYLLITGWKRPDFFQNKVGTPAAAGTEAPSGRAKAKVGESLKTGSGTAHRRPCLSRPDESTAASSSSVVLEASVALLPLLVQEGNYTTVFIYYLVGHVLSQYRGATGLKIYLYFLIFF